MQYNIIDIVDDELTDTKLKDIINKKLYKIIELMEFNANIENKCYNSVGYKFNLKLNYCLCIGGNIYEWNGECWE